MEPHLTCVLANSATSHDPVPQNNQHARTN